MAFVPYSYDDGQMMPFEYYKLAEAEDLAVGLCMALGSGGLAASATGGFICMRDEENAPAGASVPVIRVSGKTVFEAPLKAAGTALGAGSLAGVSADGLGIDPAATVKNIELVDMDGTAVGDLCRCRFVG